MSDYPSEEELRRVREWTFAHTPAQDYPAFMAYVKSIGTYWPQEQFGWRQKGQTYSISTGGWSGNESILEAMRDNFAFWGICWMEHRRGGHYEFELPEPETYWKETP